MTASSESRAQVSDEVWEAAMRDVHGEDMTGKDGPLAKAGLDLMTLYHAYTSETSADAALAEGVATFFGQMDVRKGRVTVDAVASGEVEALKSDLEALGMTRAATAGPMVSGRFPIENVPELARLETLRSVQVARPSTQSASRGGEVPLRDTNAVPAGALAGEQGDGEAVDAPEADAQAPDDRSPDERSTKETVSPDTSTSDTQPSDGPVERSVSAISSDEDASSKTSKTEPKGGSAGRLLLVLATSLILFLDA